MPRASRDWELFIYGSRFYTSKAKEGRKEGRKEGMKGITTCRTTGIRDPKLCA